MALILLPLWFGEYWMLQEVVPPPAWRAPL